jgi:hypothetical protein
MGTGFFFLDAIVSGVLWLLDTLADLVSRLWRRGDREE